MLLLQPTVPLLTSLPASPVDGQVIYYQPAAGLVQHLRYNLATTSWVSVDGKSAYRYAGYRNGAHNGGECGHWVGVNLFVETIIYDPSTCQQPGALGYVVKVAGRYLVTGQVRYSSAGTSGCAVYKNATAYLNGATSTTGGFGFVSVVVPAVVNDVLAIYLYHASGTSALTAFSVGDNWMQVELLDYV